MNKNEVPDPTDPRWVFDDGEPYFIDAGIVGKSEKTIENDPNPPKIMPFFSDRVLAFADHVFGRMMDEIDDGEFRPALREFSDAERLAFFRSLADAFSDEIGD